ncbi:MAG: uracil phosphoribosyltransferase [Candidatus Delongbacteria bacterium]
MHSFSNLRVVQHPLIQHYLTRLRDRDTPSEAFAKCVEQVASLLVPESTRDLELEAVTVRTPLEDYAGDRLAHRLVLVPILRAGLGMVPGFKHLVPDVSVAHLGLYRDEVSLEPVVYYKKLPADLRGRDLIVLDPMLATGGTACAALQYLKERQPRSLRLVCLLAAPEGVAQLEAQHPDVPVVVAALDRELNERGYILPGLGDAGDRMFGTEF